MTKSELMYFFVGGTTAVGGAGGAWASAKIAATYGRHFGAWGVVAGAVLGAVAGAALFDTIRDDSTNVKDTAS